MLATEAVFKSVGGKGGLPGHLEPGGEPLSVLLAMHPQACLVNADPFDNGMPKHTELPSILLVLGDSLTTTPSRIHIDDIVVASGGTTTTYDFGNP